MVVPPAGVVVTQILAVIYSPLTIRYMVGLCDLFCLLLVGVSGFNDWAAGNLIREAGERKLNMKSVSNWLELLNCLKLWASFTALDFSPDIPWGTSSFGSIWQSFGSEGHASLFATHSEFGSQWPAGVGSM